MTKRSIADGNHIDGHAELAAGRLSRRSFVGGATTAVAAMTLTQSTGAARAQAARRKYFWPDSARLAITVSMVIETDADPEPTTKGPDGKTYPDLYAKTAGQYAVREGIPRMLDMFDRRRIKVTSMLCGLSASAIPLSPRTSRSAVMNAARMAAATISSSSFRVRTSAPSSRIRPT